MVRGFGSDHSTEVPLSVEAACSVPIGLGERVETDRAPSGSLTLVRMSARPASPVSGVVHPGPCCRVRCCLVGCLGCAFL